MPAARVSRRALLGSCLALPFAMGAGRLPAQAGLSVVATTGMIADAARQVGGDRVTVQALMGPGVDPHAYRQTRTDIVAMARADLVLWHGLFLEAQMEDFLRDLGRDRPVVEVARALPTDVLVAHDDYADRFDPHIWMDPELWALAVSRVQRALSDLDPGGAEVYAANAAAHLGALGRLDAYAEEVLGTVPQGSRVLVTAHDAFNYFGRAYGFDVVGLQGISTQSEAGLQRVAEVVDLLVSRNVRAVFVESSVPDRSLRALIEGAAAEGHEVSIGGTLYSDAMGPPGSYEGTWIGMIDHNVTTIARALGGTAPDRGMDGRLGGAA